MTTHAMLINRTLGAALLVAATAAAGCTTKDTEAPELSGPSEFGQSISVTATPDRISQDGVSQARVEATIRDSQGKPSSGVTVQWRVSASSGVLVEPSTQQSVTDSQGRAAMFVTAPPPPAFVPPQSATITITAHTLGTDLASTLDMRQVVVQLVPPAGTLLPNRLPVASFTVAPAIGNINQEITFDASGTTDEGEPCGSLCTYQWDFGDYETASGQRVTKRFGKASSFRITLTVTDSRGGVDSVSHDLKINGPAPPVASFTSTVEGSTAIFNAQFGATITEYIWDFGDPEGTTVTTTVPGASHTYSSPGLYKVVLTVKDAFEQTHTTTSSVTIAAP